MRDLFSDPLRNRNLSLGHDPYYGNHWLQRLKLSKRLNLFYFVDVYHFIAYFTSRCKVRCTDDNCRARCWDGQKTKLPLPAEMLK